MKLLGIESTCDETAVAVVENGRHILSSVVASSVDEQALYGGVVPEIASRRHIESISATCAAALSQAGVTTQDIDAVAVTFAPGLIGAVLVGVNFAKGLAFAADKPLVPVHHLRGHVASLYLTHPTLSPPFLCLIASGGHCHLVQVHNYTEFSVLGRTVDDAAGEAFDKVARTLHLGYPGGPAIAKAALQGNTQAYALPIPKAEGRYNMSFSGLKTAVLNVVNRANMREETLDVPGLAASFQHTATEILCGRLRFAAEDLKATHLALAGGVAANTQLRSKVQSLAKELGCACFLPDFSLCGDNAAMIAAQGYYEYQAGVRADFTLNGYASWPMDESYPTLEDTCECPSNKP